MINKGRRKHLVYTLVVAWQLRDRKGEGKPFRANNCDGHDEIILFPQSCLVFLACGAWVQRLTGPPTQAPSAKRLRQLSERGVALVATHHLNS